MQPARLDRIAKQTSGVQTSSNAPGAPGASGASAVQAAAYIHDMTSTMRNLAVQHNLGTLALLLEMAAVEAGSMRAPQA